MMKRFGSSLFADGTFKRIFPQNSRPPLSASPVRSGEIPSGLSSRSIRLFACVGLHTRGEIVVREMSIISDVLTIIACTGRVNVCTSRAPGWKRKRRTRNERERIGKQTESN